MKPLLSTSYNGYIHKIDCFRTMKKSELFKNVYFTMANDLENFCKRKMYQMAKWRDLHVRPNVQRDW